MKEHPILFSGPMVRAILDGTKTQTRRICNPQPECFKPLGENGAMIPYRSGREIRDMPGVRLQEIVKCPYGQPGDRLWVRETFGDRADYAAIGALMKDRYYYAADGKKHGWKYRPSIHMPRAASRFTLEVISIRVERLQDIGEGDAKAEGCEAMHLDDLGQTWKSYKRGYQSLWESINGLGSWAANPWVWVVTFKRIESTTDKQS